MYRQFKLQCDNLITVCWLDAEGKQLKLGMSITLKDDIEERWWKIMSISKTTRNSPPDVRWKVGGLK